MQRNNDKQWALGYYAVDPSLKMRFQDGVDQRNAQMGPKKAGTEGLKVIQQCMLPSHVRRLQEHRQVVHSLNLIARSAGDSFGCMLR